MKKLFFSILLAAALSTLQAQEASKNQIQQNALGQQQIRDHTALVVGQIQNLIDELSDNGISGADARLLETAKEKLSNLSGDEMDQVLISLKQAVADPATSGTQADAMDAFAGQKHILAQFQRILEEFEERRDEYDLANRFKAMTERQTSNMKSTSRLARDPVNFLYGARLGMHQTTQQITLSEQEAVIDDFNDTVQQVNKAIQDMPAIQNRPSLQKAVEQLKTGVLQDSMTRAATDLKAGALPDALAQQKQARVELKQVTQELNPNISPADILREELAELQQVTADQKQILDKTQVAKPDMHFFQARLDSKQADIMDDADILQGDLQPASPLAAQKLAEAKSPMKESEDDLTFHMIRLGQAQVSQQVAVSKLEAAEEELKKQLDDLENATAKPPAPDIEKTASDNDPVGSQKDLLKNIQEAIQKQQSVSNQVKIAAAKPENVDKSALAQAQQQQQKVQQQTAAIQQAAQSSSPSASTSLQNAAEKMQEAQKLLDDPTKTADAQAAQQEALKHLAEAERKANEELAKAVADQQNALEKQIAKAQENQDIASSKTQQSTADPANPDKAGLTQAQEQQAEVQKQTQALQKMAENASSKAANALQKASNKMTEARDKMSDPGKTADARSAQKEAQKQLAEARQQVAKDAAEAQAQADAQAASEAQSAKAGKAQEAMASAAAGLKKAQDDVNHALASTSPENGAAGNQTDPVGAGKSLADASKEIQALQKLPLPAEVAKPVKVAQDSVARGESKAGDMNVPGVQAAAGEAHSALDQAQAALAQAQAAMAESGAQPGSQPGSEQAPGSPQSSRPGNQPGSQAGQTASNQPGQPGQPVQSPTSTSTPGNPQGITGGSLAKGTLTSTVNDGKFISLQNRDRAAIDQAKAEKRPEQYAAQIDQYLKNLADQSSSNSTSP